MIIQNTTNKTNRKKQPSDGKKNQNACNGTHIFIIIHPKHEENNH